MDASPIPNNLTVFAKPTKYRFMDALPNAHLPSFVQPSPAVNAATSSKLIRKILPKFFHPEHEKYADQWRSITSDAIRLHPKVKKLKVTAASKTLSTMLDSSCRRSRQVITKLESQR